MIYSCPMCKRDYGAGTKSELKRVCPDCVELAKKDADAAEAAWKESQRLIVKSPETGTQKFHREWTEVEEKDEQGFRNKTIILRARGERGKK